MARKVGQLISRRPRTWLVRLSLGREPETGTREYHNKTIQGSFFKAQTYLNTKLQERGTRRLPRAAAISLNQYLDQWLTTAANGSRIPFQWLSNRQIVSPHSRDHTIWLGAFLGNSDAIRFDLDESFGAEVPQRLPKIRFNTSKIIRRHIK